MKKLSLSYPSKQMEQEYATLKQQNIVQDFQMTFYFLIFFLMLPGIPALVTGHYLELAVSLATGALFIIVYCTKIIPKKYTQFVGAIIVCLFNFGVYYLPYSNFTKLHRDTLFFQGFSYGGLNVALISRFAELKQKVFFLIFAYAVRFIVIASFDMSALRWYAIVRHVYIDIFVFYINYLNEKKERSVFKSFYEYREELIKFKELLAEYLPQCLTVLNASSTDHLFCNKAFTNLFDNSETKIVSETCLLQSTMTNRSWKPSLSTLKVDKDTLREIGTSPTLRKSTSNIVYLKDIINDFILDKSSDKKAFSVSAFYTAQNIDKAFDVILTKIQWDGEKAIAVILNDITYQTDLIALKISDANKDKIMATVSHELRTPLNGIIGILEMIKATIKDTKALEYLALCKDNAHLLLSLVNSLLDLHQVRQGKLRLNPVRIEVRQVLQDILRLFTFQCHHKGIYLNLRIDKTVESHINTDENRLKQILINLIGNALKFTSSGGITVQVRQIPADPECLEISVSDTGIGIKDEDKGKLFQMYEKLEHGRGVNKNGVGLGLTISNTLASLLGKNTEDKAFEVVSKVNRGSRFTFKILKDLKELSADMDTDFKVDEDDENNSPAREHSQIILTTSPVEHKVESHILYKRFNMDLFDMEEDKNLCHFLKDEEVEDIAAEFQLGQKRSRKKNLNIRKWRTTEESPRIPITKKPNSWILVVDDNPFNLLVAENIITNLGYSFMKAKGGHEAIEMVKLKAIRGEQFCMILMDCQMPGLDGFETTRLLRELMNKHKVPATPIVALTAVNGEEDIKRCYECGMVEYLLKPLFHDALKEVLNKYKL